MSYYYSVGMLTSDPEQKVKNLFGNQNKVQKTKVPFKIARNYNGKRVFNIMKHKEIEDVVNEVPESNPKLRLKVSTRSA